MAVEIEIHRSKPFEILYDLPPDTNTVVCIGGRGGMKTYEISKFIAVEACTKRKRCVILRDEKALIKESILSEIWSRYDTANEHGILDQHFKKLDTELKDKKTGETLIYTKGFRASSNNKKANLKGESRIDIAVVEEAEDIRDQEKYNTFVDSLRKEGCLIVIMLNTPDIGHWIVKRHFTPKAIPENDGYFELIPKDIPGIVCIQTSYTDNAFLPAHIVERYEGYGIPGHYLYNPHYYLTAIKGYASTGRKGQILRKVKPITRAAYFELPFKEIYGQDFGTNSPAGMVGCKFDGNKCYVREINYLPKTALELGIMYSRMKFNHTDKIIADCAEGGAGGSIELLSGGFKNLDLDILQAYPQLRQGFYVVPCVKGAGSINGGLSLMMSMELYAVAEDENLWSEISNYVYDTDRYKNPTNDPIDDFNHIIDPWRYVITDQRGGKNMFGI